MNIERAETPVCPFAHLNVALDRSELRRYLGKPLRALTVEEHDLVVRVVRDVDELLGEETNVDRVEHRTQKGHGIVELEVASVVEAEGADAISGPNPHVREGGAELEHPFGEFPVGLPAFRGHDLAVGIDGLQTIEDRSDGQGGLLHQSWDRHPVPPVAFTNPPPAP